MSSTWLKWGHGEDVFISQVSQDQKKLYNVCKEFILESCLMYVLKGKNWNAVFSVARPPLKSTTVFWRVSANRFTTDFKFPEFYRFCSFVSTFILFFRDSKYRIVYLFLAAISFLHRLSLFLNVPLWNDVFQFESLR